MVDEFSEFARMPQSDKVSFNILEILDEVILLQTTANSDIRISKEFSGTSLICFIDPTLINQVFTNLIKNALESIETAVKNGLLTDKADGFVKVVAYRADKNILIKIIDNGIGLPNKKNQLFEPYVTSREHGIGLGLAIVKKIIEEHDGYLHLQDAQKLHSNQHKGAVAQVSFPVVSTQDGQIQLL